jgi:adenylate cyclase
MEKYGELPHFRAAIHEGTVTATVIKSMKKCIVYHGDVLNTCARIMSLCSQYNVEFWFQHISKIGQVRIKSTKLPLPTR